jgi:hypothetical protein
VVARFCCSGTATGVDPNGLNEPNNNKNNDGDGDDDDGGGDGMI